MKLRAKAFAAVLAVAALAAVLAGPAAAANPIEGVWSFNGGQVAVQGSAEGSFTGTVVVPTKFSECDHPIGEKVWNEVRRQPDGSYWGLHQWYLDGGQCIANPTRGLTAFRVLQTGDGSHFLRVCFSEPGSTSQPTIAADGTTAGATFGCSDSSLVAPLPPELSAGAAAGYLSLPANASCLPRRRLKVRLRSPAADPLAEVEVTLRSGAIERKAKLRKGRRSVLATMRLAGLTAPTFRVRVRAVTVLGHRLRSNRSYRLCVAPHGQRRHGHRPHA